MSDRVTANTDEQNWLTIIVSDKVFNLRDAESKEKEREREDFMEQQLSEGSGVTHPQPPDLKLS